MRAASPYLFAIVDPRIARTSFLLEHSNWLWWVALILVYLHLPDYREENVHPLDLVGLILFGSGSLWRSRHDLGRLQVGLDVSRIEKSVCGMIEDGEPAGGSDATSGRRELDLNRWVGQC